MILNKDVLVNNILTEISDNSTGQISPYDIRHNLLDIIDSVHLLTTGKPLNGSNFRTPGIRTTIVGEEAISKIDLGGYYSIDNTAVGYSALKSNYQGIKNTAIGSHALFCNVYGEHNVALGYSALGGNTVGIGNVGVGNYALHNNKGGNFNIAIGHGAGYYLEDNHNHKLFIASYPIDSGYICENPLGSGLTPLIQGDLLNLKLGIGVSGLTNSNAILEIGGNVISSGDLTYNLGASGYRWNNVFVRTLDFDNNTYLTGIEEDILVNASILPIDTLDNIGSSDNPWNSGYFGGINVNQAIINKLIAYEHCNYSCKTLNLVSPECDSILDGGGPDPLYDYSSDYGYNDPACCAYSSDVQASGAGLMITTSGNGSIRSYSLLFTPQNNSLSCLQSDNVYSRSAWNSNISLHIHSGCHLQTDRIIFPSSINIVNSQGCFGVFSRGSGIFVSKQNLLINNIAPSSYLGGVGNVNLFAASGDNSNYIFTIASPESGVAISQRFLTGVKKKTLDALNNNKDKLNGFEFQYIDDANGNYLGPIGDRLVIGSYDSSSEFVNATTLMKNNQTEGILGITNLTPITKNIIPVTSLNIRSATNAIGRFTAENQASTISAIQLLGGSNCLYDGFSAEYKNGQGIADLSMYKESGKSIFFRFYENNTLGLFTASGISNEMFTIGDWYHNDAVISIVEKNNDTVYPTATYGKIYNKVKVRAGQSHSLYFMDGDGNEHDLVSNPLDTTDGRCLFTDAEGNTFGGLYCPDNRNDLYSIYRNTAIGFKALYSLTTGDNNTIFGANNGSGITTGNFNSIFGSNSASSISSASNNIVIGYNTFNNTSSSSSNNIIIGNNGIGNGLSSSYRFMVGDNNIVLLDGVLGPNNSSKFLSMPSGGKFLVNDSTNTDSLQIRANYIDIIDRSGNDYPDNTLSFRFTGNQSSDLLLLNHTAVPMNNNPIYRNPIPARPYAQLNGDIRIRGAIRFSDFTSLSSANFLETIDTLSSGQTTINNTINSILGSFVEGYTDQDIPAPLTSDNPTNGILYTKNQQWNNNGQVMLVNRDTTSVIPSGSYVIAIKVNNEFRPMWTSANNTNCKCCR